ncbi:MAG TPA: helix-turn-helix domain-containing protein [Acidimicrobiales bacterium]|nr:helix-turn-helix domain-containing protein [Acidimicrobiales bacterium]
MDVQVQADDLVTTGEAARLLGSSRQHVVDLCDRGVLPHESVGTHRRIRRGDVLGFQRGRGGLRRDDVRSLWLHRAVAGKVVAEPERALRLARRNLARLQKTHGRGQAARWLGEWERLLDGPLESLLEALTSRSRQSVELRQNSPFAGLLTERERAKVLRACAEHSRRR